MATACVPRANSVTTAIPLRPTAVLRRAPWRRAGYARNREGRASLVVVTASSRVTSSAKPRLRAVHCQPAATQRACSTPVTTVRALRVRSARPIRLRSSVPVSRAPRPIAFFSHSAAMVPRNLVSHATMPIKLAVMAAPHSVNSSPIAARAAASIVAGTGSSWEPKPVMTVTK